MFCRESEFRVFAFSGWRRKVLKSREKSLFFVFFEKVEMIDPVVKKRRKSGESDFGAS